MPEAKAILRFVRVAPRKARPLIDLIRGQRVPHALTLLKYTPRAAAKVVEKVLRSAVANAEHLGDGGQDEVVPVQGREGNDPHTTAELVTQRFGKRERQAGVASAWGVRECKQPYPPIEQVAWRCAQMNRADWRGVSTPHSRQEAFECVHDFRDVVQSRHGMQM